MIILLKVLAMKEQVVSIYNNSVQNVLEPDIEEESNIVFYNTFEEPNDEENPSIDFNDRPKLRITNDAFDCELKQVTRALQ